MDSLCADYIWTLHTTCYIEASATCNPVMQKDCPSDVRNFSVFSFSLKQVVGRPTTDFRTNEGQ